MPAPDNAPPAGPPSNPLPHRGGGATDPGAGHGPVRVVVAVLTYRRPDDLAELLDTLRQQWHEYRRSARGRDHEVDVLVVDNDPDEAGRAVCLDLAADGVRYVPEPRPGIAAARNRALDEARDHDVLIFIDDDERPTSGWLTLLADTFRSTGRVGVVGPVVSRFAVPLEPWVGAGGFFDRRRLPTGTDVTVAATNNLLLDHRVRAPVSGSTSATGSAAAPTRCSCGSWSGPRGRWCGATRRSSPTSCRRPGAPAAGSPAGRSGWATPGAAPP
jgi:hypothetical protein